MHRRHLAHYPIRIFCAILLVTLCSAGTALAALGAARSQGQTGASALPADARGRLLFTRERALWTLNLGESAPAQIVPAPELGQVVSARWSPDGSRVAYALYEIKDRRTPLSGIYVAAADGSNPRRVIGADRPGIFYHAPAWAPNGSEVYVLHTDFGEAGRAERIARLNVATGEDQTIFPEVGYFDISPDGRWMAVARTAYPGTSLILLNLETREVTDLIPPGGFQEIGQPRFDPTSRTLLFAGAGPSRLGGPTRQTAGLLVLLGLGTAEAHGPPQDLYSIPVSGGPARLVLPLAADEPVASWSPDGAHLAVLSFESLAIAPSAGGTLAPILNPGSWGSVDWSR